MNQTLTPETIITSIVFGVIAINLIIFFITIKFTKKGFNLLKNNMNIQNFSMTELQNLQFFLQRNPKLLKNFISPNANNKDAIITEFQKFKKCKEIKEVSPTETDITAIHTDNSEHRYRIRTEGEGSNEKIISLIRYS